MFVFQTDPDPFAYMVDKVKEIEISQEKAVFWLDGNGCWHNADGKFRHKKIIDYFHSSIKRDHKGYHLYQAQENYKEKVYFPYEDQALFVFDVILENDIMLVLNTKKQIKLKPRKLFIKDDGLYMTRGDETIKFSEKGLLKIAKILEEKEDILYIRFKNRRYKIPTLTERRKF
jgi:hypothetical protein